MIQYRGTIMNTVDIKMVVLIGTSKNKYRLKIFSKIIRVVCFHAIGKNEENQERD